MGCLIPFPTALTLKFNEDNATGNAINYFHTDVQPVLNSVPPCDVASNAELATLKVALGSGVSCALTLSC